MKALSAGVGMTVNAGNVHVKEAGRIRQITRLGRDSDPTLSPDKQFIVFTRSNESPPGDDSTECGSDELRRIRINGTGDELLVSGHVGGKPPHQLCLFSRKQFTSDGRLLFFLSPAWVTSAALHVYDFQTRRVRYVAPANDVIVLNFCRNEYRDQLVLAQHRYFVFGGSYDWYWLYEQNGAKEVGPVGDDETQSSIISKIKEWCNR